MSGGDWWNKGEINQSPDWWLTKQADNWWNEAGANAGGPVDGEDSIDPPVVTLHPVSQSVTENDGVTLTSTATGSGTVVGQWQVNDGGGWENIAGELSSNYVFTASLGDDGKQYRRSYTNAGGTTNSNAATLTVEAPAPTAAIRFGVLTPPGEGEQDIDAADGAYNVGGGQFSVSSNRIGVVVMPSAGTYAIDGVSVAVVAGARTVSTAAELVSRWTASTSGAHPAGTRILIAPGTYELFSSISGLSRLLNNWIYEAVDPDNKPLITSTSTGQLSYYPDSGSAGFKFLNVNFYREQDPVGIPWNPVSRDIFTVRNSVTNTRFENCRFYGNLVPAQQGGKMTTKLVGLSTEEDTGVTVTNCEFDHLTTGVRLEGYVDFQDCEIHDIYSDFIEGRTGINGQIINNHMYNKIGDGSFLHGDWFQLQTPPTTPATGPLVYRGNTHTPGPFWNLAAGQSHAGKDNPTIDTAGPHTLNIADHHGCRHIFLRVEDAGGTMTINLDAAATYGPLVTFVLLQVGAGTITINLAGGDTRDAETPLTLTSNNTAVSFVSDGVSHWSRVPPGYRGNTQIRTASKTLDILEKDLGVFANATSGPLTFTLPSGTDAYVTSVKKDDTTANLVSIALPGGQTFTDHGVAEITTARTLSRCGEVMEFERLAGETVWTVTEKTTTSQGFFASSTDPVDGGWNDLEVCYNIFLVNSNNGFRPDFNLELGTGVFRNGKCYNNTFLRATPPDANGDGVIGQSDSWNDGTVGSVFVFDGVDTFRNALTGNLTDNGPTLRKAENQAFGWTDPTDLTVLNTYLTVDDPANLRPTTRAETVAAARAKVGGPLVIDAPSYSYIGAVGTTSSNGPYNWDTGTVNTNTKLPALVSMLPAIGAVDEPVNTVIRLTFDELITLGTGNISLRVVGGSEIESFDVTSSGQLEITSDGLVLLITPTSNLPDNTNVCVRIDATAIDGYFNSFAGIADDSVEFTTSDVVLDPEMLPDPSFDTPSQWRAGSGSAGSFPFDGWTVASGLASKASGTASFRFLQPASDLAASPSVTYEGKVVVNAVTSALGSLRVTLTYFAADGTTQLATDNDQLLLSGLAEDSEVAFSSASPSGTAFVRMLITATDGDAVFSLKSASLQPS